MDHEGADAGPRPSVTLFLAGDVMTGRGIDRILPHPGDPRLYEPCVDSADEYVALAERVSGPIARPAAYDYVWGDALDDLAARRPEARIVNLETALTRGGRPAPKGINYRMNPANIGVLTAAGIDCCVLANNHVLDWGETGLRDTLDALDRAGIARAGAGTDLHEAAAPAILSLAGGGRVLVFAFGCTTSGIPRGWAAAEGRMGVNLLADLTPRAVRQVAASVEAVRRAGDLIVASLHWGPNWGYDIPDEERAFARALVDEAGVDVVHGHSSHHPKAVEVHRGRAILYGCGDFVDDYEGIAGHEAFRDDLVLGHFLTLDRASGALARLELVPYQLRRLRLSRVLERDRAWLERRLNEIGREFGTRLRAQPDGAFDLLWD